MFNENRCVHIVEKYLAPKFTYSCDKENRAFSFDVGVDDVVGAMHVVIVVRKDFVNCVAIFPFCGSETTAHKLSEFVCRVNLHLSAGHLDYDFNDGKVCFTYDLTVDQLKSEKGDALDRFFGGAAAVGKKFGPAIALLALGLGGSPEKLYRQALFGSSAGEDASVAETVPAVESANPETAKPTKPDTVTSDNPVTTKSVTLNCVEEKAHRPQERQEDTNVVPVRNYSLDGLHVVGDFPIAKVESAARKFFSVLNGGGDALPDRPGLNILLWGPPGGGKSEFVNYLGQTLGRKVLVKMGSDILSHLVGGTEKCIREAFEEAEEEGAILFLDELDGLMQNRASATAAWEVSQVNELLHRMEHFKGIMIGATNFKDNLDPAVLRRFTYKLQFDYLEAAGKCLFFDRAFKTSLTEVEKDRLGRIENLTPGDFRTVSQSLFYLDDEVDNGMRLAALEKESAMKNLGHKVCAGFSG